MSLEGSGKGETRKGAKGPKMKHNRDDLVSKCQADFAARRDAAAMETCLIPPDLGSQLYAWYLENDHESSSEYESPIIEHARPSAMTSDSHPGGSTQAAMLPRHGAKQEGKRRLSGPSLQFSKPKRQQLSPPSSPSNSPRELVFSPSTQKPESMTSDSECFASSSKQLRGSQTTNVQPQHPPSPTKSRKSALAYPYSPAEDAETYTDIIKTRPATLPRKLDDVHPADRMLMAKRWWGHDWGDITLRWKQMTGENDPPGQLEWRYKMIKQIFELWTDAAMSCFLDAGPDFSGSAPSRRTSKTASLSLAPGSHAATAMAAANPGSMADNDDDDPTAVEMVFERQCSPREAKPRVKESLKQMFVNDRKRSMLNLNDSPAVDQRETGLGMDDFNEARLTAI